MRQTAPEARLVRGADFMHMSFLKTSHATRDNSGGMVRAQALTSENHIRAGRARH